MSISENDIQDPTTEEPETPAGSGNGDNGDNEGNEENNNGSDPSETGGEENGEGNNADPPETGGGDQTGCSGGEAPPDVEAPGYGEKILDSLSSVVSALEDNPDYSGLAESVRSLVDVVTLQTEALQNLSVSGIPISGYTDYAYPVYVVYRIYPTALGSATGYSEAYETPEDFENGYAYMVDSVDQGNLAWFNIRYINDAGGNTVYDSETAEPEPEEPEEPEEPDTFKDDVLARLDALGESLDTVSMNSIDSWEQSLENQEQYLANQEQLIELQKEAVQLNYGILAGTLVLSFTLLFTLGYMVAHGFLQRMKVG